jgi:hypothetical protein
MKVSVLVHLLGKYESQYPSTFTSKKKSMKSQRPSTLVVCVCVWVLLRRVARQSNLLFFFEFFS